MVGLGFVLVSCYPLSVAFPGVSIRNGDDEFVVFGLMLYTVYSLHGVSHRQWQKYQCNHIHVTQVHLCDGGLR